MSSTEALQPDKDAVLYLVDGSRSMLASGALSKVLAAVVSSLLLINRRGDRRFDVGVVIYGVVNNPSARSRFSDVNVLMKVGDPQVEDFKKLIALVQSGVILEPRATSSGKSSLLNALQQVKLEMASLNPTVFRRLVVITDDDCPPDFAGVRVLTHDLVNLNVLTVPTFIEHSGRSFDNSKFWRHLVYLPPSISMASRNARLGVSLDPCDIDDLPTEFANLVLSKAERKIPAFRGELILHSLRISIAAYSISKKSSSSRKVHISRHTTFEESGSALRHDPNLSGVGSESRRFILGAHQNVPIEDADELYSLRAHTKRSRVEIRGFVHIDKLRPIFGQEFANFGRVGSSLLIVPSNSDLENSKPAFGSLRRSLVRKSCVPWVALYSQVRSRPPVYGYLFAFDPSPKLFEEQLELRPSTHSGFYFVNAACSDDLRYTPPYIDQVDSDHSAAADRKANQAGVPHPDLVKPLQRLTSKFRMKKGFDPSQFPDPGRLQFANVLEALALDLDMPSVEAPDSTLPDYRRISKHVAGIAGEILDRLTQIEPQETSKKRKISDLKVFREAQSIGRLHCFKVPELKWALEQLNLVVSGNKSELIARLAQHL